MLSNLSLPWWAYALMGTGLCVFIALIAITVHRNRGMHRSLVRVALCAVDDDFYHRSGHSDCLLRLYGFLRRVHAGQLPQLLGLKLRIEQNHPGRHGRSRTGIHFPRHGQRGYAGLLAVDGVPVHGYLPAAGLSGGADYGRPRNQTRPDPRRAVHHPHVDELPPAHHCLDEPAGR